MRKCLHFFNSKTFYPLKSAQHHICADIFFIFIAFHMLHIDHHTLTMQSFKRSTIRGVNAWLVQCVGQRCCLGAPRLLFPPLHRFVSTRPAASGQFGSCKANNKSVLIAESLLGSLFNLQTHTLITACVL